MKELRISFDHADLQVLVGGGIVGVPPEFFAKYGVKDAPSVLIALKDIGYEVAIHTVMRGAKFTPNQVVWKKKDSW